jgi:glycosyltransferase involved in cell wall biosynthesis
MRLIHTVPSIAKEASGPSYSVPRLCGALVDQGEDVTLAALDWAQMDVSPAFLKKFPLGFGHRRLGRSPQMRKWLYHQAQVGKIDFIHNHSLWMMPNVYPGQIAKRFGVPYAISPRGCFTKYAMAIGSPIKKLFWPLVQRPALDAVSLFHATAESELDDIRAMGYRQPVAVIPNGIDLPEQLPKTDSGLRRLLFLGRIHPNKGLDLLLPAWKAVEDRFPDWQLSVIGPQEDAYFSKMMRLAENLAIQRIEFSGAKFGSGKWQAYANAELFVLPSYSENFGMTVAEALASGVPSIVTKGAPWSGLEPNGSGWWIDIGVDPLVACLESALALSPKALKEMGDRGRTWMTNEYSWQRIGQQMIDAYRWVLHGGRRPLWVVEY